MSASIAIIAAPLTPVVGALAIWLARNHPWPREAATIVASLIMFGLVASLYPEVAAGGRPSAVLAEPLPGLVLAFEVEPLGMLFALVASFLWIVTSVYSIGYMHGHHETNLPRYFVCFALSLGAAIGVAFAANLFTLFVFYEALTLSTYPLVAHRGDDAARRGARVYLGVLLTTSIGMFLLAIILTWNAAGTLDFVPGGILADKMTPTMTAVLLGLFVFGIGKAAIMPFHRWLPAAMVAPAPVSALLHAVAVVKAGVFCVMKITVYIFGIENLAAIGASRWLMYVAAATVLIGAIVALNRDNLKARLAYSTVSQLAYIVLGAMLANSWGVIGGGMHIAMHAFGKITLFLCAGAIVIVTDRVNISELRGLGRAMPVTMGAFLVASLSLIGLPPFGGMWSKWYLALGTLEAGEYPLLAVLLLGSILSVAYLIPIPLRAFFSPPDDPQADARLGEAPLACVVPLTLSAFVCLVLFVYPDPLYRLLSTLVP